MSEQTSPSPGRKLMSLGVGLVLVLVGATLIYLPTQNDNTILRVDGGDTFIIEIADDPEERAQGLGGRDSLGQRDAMLFVHETPGLYAYSMRGMQFDLDFIWITDGKIIADIDKNVMAGAEPVAQAFPTSEITYVLEVNAGIADELGWEIGQTVEFNVD